jgi:hypothetical protein
MLRPDVSVYVIDVKSDSNDFPVLGCIEPISLA